MNIYVMHETRYAHLTLVHQDHGESIFHFLKCFKDINNRSFHKDSKRGLTNLVFDALCSNIKERLEYYEFLKF